MPFDLEAEIARRLQVAPETVGPALNAVIERIRQQVSHFGYARVAGLGTFRGDNGHLAFEPELVIADEVNARFAGLEVLDVAPSRQEDEEDDVEPLEVPDEDDETLYGPSPGDDYERGDAGMDDGEGDDIEGDDADRAEDAADPHATITPVYDPARVPGAEYDVESHAADEGGIDEWPETTDASDDEPAYAEGEIGVPPDAHVEGTERTEDSPAAFRWEDHSTDIERDAEPPVEEEPDPFEAERTEATDADADDTGPFWTGGEEHADDQRETPGLTEGAADRDEEDWRAGEALRGAEDEGWRREEESPEVEGIPAAGWVDDTPEPDAGEERFAAGYDPAEYEPPVNEPAEREPAEEEPAGYESAEDVPEDEWATEPETQDDAYERRPAVEWNPPEERSEADLYAEEEAAMAAGAVGGAAAAAGDREEYVDEGDAFSEAGEAGEDGGMSDVGKDDAFAGDHAGVDTSDEFEGAFDEAAERERSLETASDLREGVPPPGAREHADRRPSAGSAATTDAVVGRRSAVLIGIGIVVLLAAAALIYLVTSTSPVEEAAGPGIAETPTAQDTAAVAASEAPGAAASDTADLAVTTPPADPTSDQPPSAETPLDPLRGTEPIDRAAGGYTLVVFSDFSDSNANTVALTYRDQGFRTGVLDDQNDGRTRFRVSVGQFSTLDEAVEARDRLAGNGLPDDAWVRRIQ